MLLGSDDEDDEDDGEDIGDTLSDSVVKVCEIIMTTFLRFKMMMTVYLFCELMIKQDNEHAR